MRNSKQRSWNPENERQCQTNARRGAKPRCVLGPNCSRACLSSITAGRVEAVIEDEQALVIELVEREVGRDNGKCTCLFVTDEPDMAMRVGSPDSGAHKKSPSG
jgi:hypothetical protein